MTRLRHMSDRRREREDEARPTRVALKERLRRCEVCGRQRETWELAIHEISNGPLRQTSLDLLFALLAVCFGPNFAAQTDCHRITQEEPETRQLARLWLSRPEDFDLKAYLTMTRPAAPNRILPLEVAIEAATLRLERNR